MIVILFVSLSILMDASILKRESVFLILLLLCFRLYSQEQSFPLETVIQRGHRAAIWSVAYSPDGKYIATGSRDYSIKLWEVSTGREIRSFLGHLNSVTTLVFDPTGNYIASGSYDKSVILWEVATGVEKLRITGHNDIVTSVAFSPDGTAIASAGWDWNAYLWNRATGDKIAEFKVRPDKGTGNGTSLNFSEDGSELITGNDNGMIMRYDWAKNVGIDTLRNIKFSSCGGCPTFTALHKGSNELISASNGGPVSLWNLKTGKLIREYGKDHKKCKSVGVAKQYVFVAKEDSILIWNINGKSLHKIEIKHTKLNAAAISPDGKYITSVGDDRLVQIWNTSTGRLVKTLKGILNNENDDGLGFDPESRWQFNISRYLNFRDNIKISPDEKHIAKGHIGSVVQLWDLMKGRIVRTFEGHEKAVLCFEFSKDGKYLFTGSGDHTIKMWEVATGKVMKTFEGHRELVFELALSNNGKYLLTGGWDATAILWDIEKGTLIKGYKMDNNSPYSLSFALNDLYFLVGGLGKEFRMIELDTGESSRTFIGHTDIVSDVNMQNSTALTASWDRIVKLWDISTGLIIQKLVGHKGHVYKATFDSSGNRVATASADRTIKLWDVATGEVLQTFQGHSDAVTSVNFINNDSYLISHSLDGTTKIWDITTGKEIITHILIGIGDWLVKNDNGFFDATEEAKKNIFFVRGMKSYSLDQFFEEFYRPNLLYESFHKSELLNYDSNIKFKLDESPPPTIEIISPKVGELFTNQDVDVMVKITNEGGGIDEVKLLHNGKRLEGDDRAIRSNPKKGKSVYQSFPIHLIPGKNILSVSAFSEARIESSVINRELLVDGVNEDITCHVMAIGINTYRNPTLNLNYAFEDAEAFLKLVKTKGKKLFNKIELYALFNEEATKVKILATLDEIVSKAKPQDVFFFYYAGHGSMVDGSFYFIPTENIRLYDLELLTNEAISAGSLQEKFTKIAALKQLVVLDACQSGGSTTLLATRGASEEKAMAQLSRSSGVHVLAASGSEQFATEFKELGHGLFTYVLLEALSGSADGAPKDGKVTIYELKAYLDSQVPEYSSQFKGKPQYPVTYSKGQDFPIVID